MTIKTRRDKGRPRGQAVVNRILESAILELARQGPIGFSVDRVAAAAELNKTSVYRRWPTKGALIAAALEAVQMRVSSALPDTGALRTDLIALVAAIAAFAESAAGRGLLSAIVSQDKIPEIASFASIQIAAGLSAPAGDIFTRAISRGEWSQDVRPEQLLSLIAGAVIHRIFLEQLPLTSSWTEGLINIIWFGIAPSKS